MNTDQSDRLSPSISPAGGWRRKLLGAGVILFLAFQVAMPTSYYLRGEPTSERFAWRMFSSIDLSTWDTRMYVIREENGELVQADIDPRKHLQETYVKTVERVQIDVVEAFMRALRDRPHVREVHLRAQGTLPNGEMMDLIHLVMRPGDQHATRVNDDRLG